MRGLALAVATSLGATALPQPVHLERAGGPPDRPSFSAVAVAKGPVIDGRLDDEAWQSAKPVSAFTQFFPDERKEPTQRTEVRIVYDDKALYVGFRCFDTAPGEIVRSLSRRDRSVEADFVSVAIDGLHDHRSARQFTVNAANVQADSLLFNDTEGSTDWDAVWESEVSVDAEGWAAEIAIPLRVIRYHAAKEGVWGLQLRRYISRRSESDVWAFTPRDQVQGVAAFGDLVGLHDVTPSRDLEFLPYAATSVALNSGLAPQYDATAGIDARYGITPDLSLSLTVNPDFGQVEADPSVLNLSTYEVFFPEKRPFFLEGMELFQPPYASGGTPSLQLFYTRRIGRSPPSENLDCDASGNCESLVSEPGKNTIAEAAKVSGQLAQGWSMSALDAVTTSENATVDARPVGRTIEQREVAPTTNYGVFRLRRDFETLAVGGTFTAVSPVAGPGQGVDTSSSLCNTTDAPYAGRCYRTAETAGVDWRWRPQSQWLFAGQLVTSYLAEGPVKQIPDGTVIRPGDAGFGGQLRFAREGGENFLFRIDGEFATKKLDLNEMGYQRRPNYERLVVTGVARTTQPVLFLEEGEIDLSGSLGGDNDGVKTEEGLELDVSGRLPGFWWVGGGASASPTYWDDRELQDGTRLWRPADGAAWAFVSTDSRKAIQINSGVFAWTNFEGGMGGTHGGGFNINANLRPATRYDAQLSFAIEKDYESARNICIEPTSPQQAWLCPYLPASNSPPPISGDYALASRETRQASLTLRQSLALTSRLTLQTYTQIFIDSATGRDFWSAPIGRTVLPSSLVSVPDPVTDRPGHPLFHQSFLNITVVARWEFLPGSALYLVYSRAQQEASSPTPAHGIAVIRDLGTLGGSPSTDTVLVKLAYWFGL